MQLADYVRILRRRALLIVVATVFGALGAFVATAQQAKLYRTDVQFIVSVNQSGPGGDISRRPVAVAQAVALAQLARTPTAVAAAATQAGGGRKSSVSATADNNSPFINLTVSGTDPVVIAKVADAYATVLPQVQKTLRQADPGTVVTLISDQPAPVNTVPVSPRPRTNLAIGLVLGLVLGLSAAFLREALDRRVRDSSDLERITGLTLLGSIPKELDAELLPALTHADSLRAEAYRLVRVNVQFTDVDTIPPCMLVTSSNPGDGKTSLATNLGVSCAQAGERVIVVDADLRQPRVAAHFGLAEGPGLSDVLTGRRGLDHCVHVNDNLSVLPAGPPPPNPSELLGSPRMLELLEHLRRSYDRVVLDGPPILAVADAVKLASFVTGVVVVVRIEATTYDDVKRAKQRLDQAGARVLGTVANRVHAGRDGAYGYGSRVGYGYASGPASGGRRGARVRAGRATPAVALPPPHEPSPPSAPAPAVAPPAPSLEPEVGPPPSWLGAECEQLTPLTADPQAPPSAGL